jgi:threonine/homoserine/homoserine lactone efflux protein
MLGIHDYWLFVLTGVLLNLTPGQDTMFILGRCSQRHSNLRTPRSRWQRRAMQGPRSVKTLAFLTLGITFVTTGTIWCLLLALGAARLRHFFQGNPRMRITIDRVTGGLFIALGLRLAVER